MRTFAGQYPRAGYRTMMIFLARQQHVLRADRAYRFWRQAGLQVPRRRPRRRVATSRPRPRPPTAINHVWAYDVVFNTCADGRTLECLTVIDEFTRECVAIDVAGAFVARAVLRWLLAPQIETAFIDPGKPWQNGVDESFNGKFRHEHLSRQWFRTRAEAAVSIEQWRRHDNEVRPHSSRAYRTPHEFKAITETTTRTGRLAAAPPRAEQDEDRTEEPNVLTNPEGAMLQ